MHRYLASLAALRINFLRYTPRRQLSVSLSRAVGLACCLFWGAPAYAGYDAEVPPTGATLRSDRTLETRWARWLQPMVTIEQPGVARPDARAESPPFFGQQLDVTVWGLTWISTGRTKNSDNGNALSPLLGNPSSTLDFDDLDSTVFEAGVQLRIADGWFVRAAYGRGDINSGRFVDDDFVTSQGAAFFQASIPSAHMISRSEHEVGGGSGLWYVTADLGKRLVTLQSGRGGLDGFVGFQFWREYYEVSGGSQVVCTSSPATSSNPFCNPAGTPFSGLSLTNSVEWTSFRLGLATQYQVSRVRLDANLAFIPYTRLFSEDSHLLRDDLRQPSFTLRGEGIGAEGEIALSLQVLAGLYLNVGYRYWWLKTLDGTSTAHPLGRSDVSDPLTEHTTIRHGVTLGAQYRF